MARWRPTTRWRAAQPPGSWDRDPGMAELIRFAGSPIDPHSGQSLGIFQLAARIAREGQLTAEDRASLRAHLRWFNRNLAQPRRFSHHRDGFRRSGSGIWMREPIAISWFKAAASAHLRHIEGMATLLGRSGVELHELRTRRPGYVVYEDDHQVVAVPFPGEHAPSIRERA
jgi:hypothetical protein